MPVIKVNNLQYSLHRGPNRLGSGADADVQVEGDGVLGVQAIVELANDGQVVIRRADTSADVRVNGILLVDPAPLMHGDKVEISGTELLFADDTKSGNTSFVSSADIAAIVQKRSGPARPTSATGGRLVSLVDGKEYSVPSAGITIGRDAGAGIVVAQNDVSRKHAEISPVEGGYELRDFSVNGVYVNGTRVVKTQVLARSDVIRVGTEEFRFYADVRPAAPAAPAAPVSVPSLAVTMMGMPAGARGNNGAPPVAPPAAPKRSPAATTPAIAPAFVASAPSAAPPPARPSPALPEPVIPPEPTAPPSPVRADPRPVLATLEIANSGPTKGQVYPIHVPLVHVGRGGTMMSCYPTTVFPRLTQSCSVVRTVGTPSTLGRRMGRTSAGSA